MFFFLHIYFAFPKIKTLSLKNLKDNINGHARKEGVFSECLNDTNLGFTYLAVMQQSVESNYSKN